MTGKSAKVIVLRKLPAAIETRMVELFDVEFSNEDRHLGREEIASAMARADVLVSTVTDTIDAELIENSGDQLKLIANFGNGVDNIDVDAAYARNITVTNTPSVLTEDTADMVMALILALPRRMVEGDRICVSLVVSPAGPPIGFWVGDWGVRSLALLAWGVSGKQLRSAQ